MKNYTWTLTGLILAISLLAVDLIMELDLFESFASFLSGLEGFEIDEFVLPSFLLIGFSLLDFVRYKKIKQAELEKEQVYKAMVQASDHILKNCLNQMLLMRMEAEETPGFNTKTLELFDQSMAEAMEQLEALGKISEVDEDKIGKSVNIKIFR